MVKEKETSESKRLESIRNKSFSKSKTLSKEIRDTKKEFIREGRSQEDLNKAINTIKEKRNERAKEIAYGGLSQVALVGERLGSAVSRALSKPILKKPTVNIKTISNKALIKSFANSGYTMFNSNGWDYANPLPPIPQDNRSLFFQETLNREKKFNRGWL